MAWKKHTGVKAMDYKTLSGGALAYIGDAVFELQVRKRLIDEGQTQSGKMNKEALSYVTATSQSGAVERILPHLSAEEEEVYRRGRNANGISAPKSAAMSEYRRATGLEALFGWLYLHEYDKRIEELFELAFPKETAENKENIK